MLMIRSSPRLLRTQAVVRSVACFSTDTKALYEEQHHLGRALSRSNVTPQEQKEWSAKAKRFPKQWNHAIPSEDNVSFFFGGAKYEINALEEIHKRSYDANVLLEIRDVRLPASTHHPSFTRLARHREHLICYTHADMIDASTRDRVERWTVGSWPKSSTMFVDTRQNRGDAESFTALYDWIADALDRRGGANCALTVGVPNTGKSSVLQCLLRTAKNLGHISSKTKIVQQQAGKKKKKKKKLKTSQAPGILDVPGKTRELTEYLLREKPRMFFVDVPGMTPPPFMFQERPAVWYGFGAANLLALPKHVRQDCEVQRSFCDYVLHCLNRDQNFQYVKKLGLDMPTDSIDEALARLANKHADRLDSEALLLKRSETFLKLFNTGNFGSAILDDIRKPYEYFRFKDAHFNNKRDDSFDDTTNFEYEDDLFFKAKK